MPTVDLAPGLTLHYLHENQEADHTVILLHGLGVTSESWLLQIPALKEAGFRILAPDTRGFGKSTCPGGKNSVEKMAEDMVGLLDSLEIALADVVGISMGGTIALQMALSFPQKIRRMVLVNTFACLRPENPGVLLYFAFRYILAQTLGLKIQARAVARRLFPGADQESLRQILVEQILQADPRGYRAAMRSLGSFDVRRRLKEISAPTLVITGEKDTTVPPKTQHLLVEAIPNARQVMIPGAGHAVTVEQPQKFNLALLNFLNEMM